MKEIIVILKSKFGDPLFYGGLLALFTYLRYLYTYYYFDTYRYLLWYSSLGLILLSVALLSRNYILLSISFCSLFAIEGLWFINFFLALFFGFSFGNIKYEFIPGATNFDFLGSTYHLLLAPLSFFGVILSKKVYEKAWIYSSVAALVLGLLTYLFLDNLSGDNINCVFESCELWFSPVYSLTNPLRIFVGSFLLSVFVFLPSNYLIMFLKRVNWRKILVFVNLPKITIH